MLATGSLTVEHWDGKPGWEGVGKAPGISGLVILTNYTQGSWEDGLVGKKRNKCERKTPDGLHMHVPECLHLLTHVCTVPQHTKSH